MHIESILCLCLCPSPPLQSDRCTQAFQAQKGEQDVQYRSSLSCKSLNAFTYGTKRTNFPITSIPQFGKIMFLLLLSFAECFARRPATLSRVYEKSNNTVLEVVPPSSHSISLRVGEKPNRDKRVLRKSRPAFSPSDRERQMKKFFLCKNGKRKPNRTPFPLPIPCTS